MPIEVVPVTKLHPHPDNPRQGDVGAIVTSIQQNGWYGTLVAQTSTGRVLAGNHRLQAAAQIGMTEVPVYWVDVDDVTARKILLADNRTNDLATYDDDLLSLLLTDLASTDDLLGTGYDGDDLDDLLGDLAGFDPIDDPGPGEPPAVPVTKLGDVILLGDHRLVCGDATDPACYPADAALLVTDPPYGVSYADKNEFLNAADKGNQNQTPIKNDHLEPDEVAALWVEAFTAAQQSLRPGGVYYITGPQGGDLLLLLLQSIKEAGLILKHMLIWVKNNHVLGRCDYNYKHEPILYGWKEGAGHKFYGDGTDKSVCEIAKPHSSKLHPTMKPVELYLRAIRNSSRRGEVVLDPFAGSGTCVIAAEETGRSCHAIELDPAYCDVIVNRWEEATGKEAIRP